MMGYMPPSLNPDPPPLDGAPYCVLCKLAPILLDDRKFQGPGLRVVCVSCYERVCGHRATPAIVRAGVNAEDQSLTLRTIHDHEPGMLHPGEETP